MQTFDPDVDAFGKGPDRLVVVGPPGTGKTRTSLEHFILPALRQCMADRILACSFSNAAADELKGRLSKRLGVSTQSLRETCSTIHSEALRRYRRFGNPNPRLYNPATRESKEIKWGSVEQPSKGGNELTVAAAEVWDMARHCFREDELQELCSEAATTRRFTGKDLEAAVRAIEHDKVEQNSLDFTDMLAKALHYEPREVDLLLVDECQDLTPLQWALVDHWSKKAARVVLLGDHDQSVHAWMGVNPDILLDRIRSWDVRILSQSYRVPRAVHAVARDIILRVQAREDADYHPLDIDGLVTRDGMPEVAHRLHQITAEYVAAPEEYDTETGEVRVLESTSAFILCRANFQCDRIKRWCTWR